jgi:hypothetical protein
MVLMHNLLMTCGVTLSTFLTGFSSTNASRACSSHTTAKSRRLLFVSSP